MLIVSDATKSVFFVPDYNGVKTLSRLFWYLERPIVDPDEAMASRHFAKRSGYKSVPFEEVDLVGKEDYKKVALVISPANALIQAWSIQSRTNPRRRPHELENLVEAGMVNGPNFNQFLTHIEEYKKALPRLAAALNTRFEALGKDSTFFDEIIKLDDTGALEAYLKTRTKTKLPSQNFKLEFTYPGFFSPADVDLVRQAAASEYEFFGDAYQSPEGFLKDGAGTYKKNAKKIPEFKRHDHAPDDEFQVVIIIMETPEVATHFVNYYASIGASKIHMYFDDPDDPSIDLVKDHPQVNAIACNEDFWQGKRKSAFEGRQSQVYTHAYNTMDRGWLLAVDSDEFVVADKPIPELFASMPEDARVVRFDSTEAVWAEGNSSETQFSADFVRHQISHAAWRSVEQHKDPSIRNMFRHGILSHRSGKYAVRVRPDVKRLGTHKVFYEDRYNSMHPPKGHPRGKLVHFDAISFSRWKAKFVRRLSAGHGFAGFGPGREEQHEGMRNISEDDYQKFHDSLYKISKQELELQANLKGITRLRIFEDMPDYFAAK